MRRSDRKKEYDNIEGKLGILQENEGVIEKRRERRRSQCRLRWFERGERGDGDKKRSQKIEKNEKMERWGERGEAANFVEWNVRFLPSMLSLPMLSLLFSVFQLLTTHGMSVLYTSFLKIHAVLHASAIHVWHEITFFLYWKYGKHEDGCRRGSFTIYYHFLSSNCLTLSFVVCLWMYDLYVTQGTSTCCIFSPPAQAWFRWWFKSWGMCLNGRQYTVYKRERRTKKTRKGVYTQCNWSQSKNTKCFGCCVLLSSGEKYTSTLTIDNVGRNVCVRHRRSTQLPHMCLLSRSLYHVWYVIFEMPFGWRRYLYEREHLFSQNNLRSPHVSSNLTVSCLVWRRTVTTACFVWCLFPLKSSSIQLSSWIHHEAIL